MSATATPQQSDSRDVALTAIAEAQRLLGQADEKLAHFDALVKETIETQDLTDEQPGSAGPLGGALRGRLVLRSLMGLLALGCIGIAVLAWQSTAGQMAPELNSTSSIKKKEELPAQPAPGKADVAAMTDAIPPHPSRAQTTLERVASEAPAPMAPDLTLQIQAIVRELATVEQGIEQLKTGQAQMARDNAELAEHLKAAQGLARRNADLTEDLKAAQAQLARDNVNFAEQLRASHEQMAKIAEQLKESQEQASRLVASGQKQRPRTLASSPPPIANSTLKPVPTPQSPLVRGQTLDPRHTQPKQQ
jgi:DNA repair exonuclease SbcCD ATPase subunit